MRILFLTSRLPYPPNRGDRYRAYHFLRLFAQEHEVTLVSFIADVSEAQHVDSLHELCTAVHFVHQPLWKSVTAVATNFWRSAPLQTAYYRSKVMQQLIDGLIETENFDAVYVHLFRMAPYVAKHKNLYRIIDLTDVISREIKLSLPYRNRASRLFYQVEGARIERTEREMGAIFEEIWLINQADHQELAAKCPQANIQIAPTGVDFQRFTPTGTKPHPNSLLFVGHLDVFHNIDAIQFLVNDIFPLIRKEIPDCTLKIVGAGKGEQIRPLAQIPGVTVAGYVADLNLCLRETAVFIAPLRFCAGVQIKVLEALAAARPVVTTPNVNSGLGAQADIHLLLGETAVSLAEQTIALLKNPQRQAQIGQAGRQFMQRYYNQQSALLRLQAITKQLKQEKYED